MIFGRSREEKEIRQIGQGDAAAMKSLYDTHIGYLTAVCSRYIIDEDDLKDVLQDSFIKIFTSIDKFEYRGKGSVRAWLTRIVVNEALTFLKKKERLDVVHTEWGLPEQDDTGSEDATSLADQVSPEQVQELIRQLPPGYRTVFNLYVFENKSHREIAKILNIKENTSASQLHKAKSMLAKKIKQLRMPNYG